MISDLETFFKTYSKEKILNHLVNSPEDLAILQKAAVNPNEKYAWRCCWMLRFCAEKHLEKIEEISSELVHILPEAKDNHQREILNLLNEIVVHEEDEGKLFDSCITIWEKTKIQPSVRFHAFKTILKIAKKYPELKSEIEFLTETHFMEPLTYGVRHSLNKLLKDFRKN